MTEKDLKNSAEIDPKGKKKVLVTGSSRGIGKEIALYLAKNGYDIDVHYAHNKEKAQETADEIKALGREAQILKFDIKNREECSSDYTCF